MDSQPLLPQPTSSPSPSAPVPSPPNPAPSSCCPLCSATFATPESLRSHISTAHPNANGLAPVLAPLHPPFPAPAPVLPALSTLPVPSFAPFRQQHASWLPIQQGQTPQQQNSLPQLQTVPDANNTTPPIALPAPPTSHTLFPSFPTTTPTPQPVHTPQLTQPQSQSQPQPIPSIPTPPTSTKNPSLVQDSALYCSVCAIQCETTDQFECHLQGQKHRKKFELNQAFDKARQGFQQHGLRQLSDDVWTCLYCTTQMRGKTAVMQHIKAVKHIRNIQLPLQTLRPQTFPSQQPAHSQPQQPSRSPQQLETTKKRPRHPVTAIAPPRQATGSGPRPTTEQTNKPEQRKQIPATNAVNTNGTDANAPASRTKTLPPFKKSRPNPQRINQNHRPPRLVSVLPPSKRDSPTLQALDSQGFPSTLASPPRGDAAGTTRRSPTSINAQTTVLTGERLRSPNQILATNHSLPLLRSSIAATTSGLHSDIRVPTSLGSDRRNEKVQLAPAKALNDFSCVMCNVICNSLASLNSHLASAKHLRKQFVKDTLVTQGTQASDAGQITVGGDGTHYCQVCNIYCSGRENFQSHLRGKLHSKRVRSRTPEATGSQ